MSLLHPVAGQAGQRRRDASPRSRARPITAREFQRELNRALQMFQRLGRRQPPTEMLKQLGYRSPGAAVADRAAGDRGRSAAARAQVTDVEVRRVHPAPPRLPGERAVRRLRALPRRAARAASAADRDGVRGERPRRPARAEAAGRRSPRWVTVSDAEVDDEYRRRNEKVKLEVVAFQADPFRTGLTATDAEARAPSRRIRRSYRFGERRKIRYLLVDTQALRAAITPTAQEIEAYYRPTSSSSPTRSRCTRSTSCSRPSGKDEAAVRKQAESVLEEAKAPGADFAALARSTRRTTRARRSGGDLEFFGRGAMVKPFEDVAFALAPGQTSGPGQDRLRLPHHQGAREARRRPARARRGAGPDHRAAEMAAGAGARHHARDGARRAHHVARRPRRRGAARTASR